MTFLFMGASLIIGMIVGRFFADDLSEDCPRRVLGFNCRADCDHRKSVLYGNMMHMAKQAEEDKEKNLWGGSNNA